MVGPPLEGRVSILEEKVGSLEQLPARVDALELQIQQLRGEMRAEFSATRQEIVAGDEETRRFMRVLYEDLVARIATIGSATPPRRPKR